MGRPLKFETVEELQAQVDAYFAECDPHWIDVEYWTHPKKTIEKYNRKTKETEEIEVPDFEADMILETQKALSEAVPYTITGLALALDTTRETLLDYEERDEYSDTIKKAKLKCQFYAERHLFTARNSTGAIFNLKNNYHWKDSSEVKHSGHINKHKDLTDEELNERIQRHINRQKRA